MGMDANRRDVEALIREKYDGKPDPEGMAQDMVRLSNEEPLAYVIGNIPFLGLTIHLDSRPLIPRSETEWWTELLIERIKELTIYHTDSTPVSVLDLCAGSGAVGLAVLKHCPNTRVSFVELVSKHVSTIRKNIEVNGLDALRTALYTGDLFTPLKSKKITTHNIVQHLVLDNEGENRVFDIIACNPPYIPETRVLDASVRAYEPAEALWSGADGLTLINRIIIEAPSYLADHGELWMECDTSNIRQARELASKVFRETHIRTDQYGRERLLVAHL